MFERLVETFMKFPGIGPRQARRFVYHLIHQDNATLELFINDIKKLKQNFLRCTACQRLYSLESTTNKTICELCQDTSRDSAILMIVEKDIDLENVKKSGTYHGHFFVLGSLPSITDQPPIIRRQKELLRRISEMAELREIIIALSATPDGDHAMELLKQQLITNDQLQKSNVKVSVLGRGLSTGTELEYSDADTLKNALKNRG